MNVVPRWFINSFLCQTSGVDLVTRATENPDQKNELTVGFLSRVKKMTDFFVGK